MEINQYQIVLINLDPTVGHEIKKTRPCVVISPDELNHNLQTIIVAPVTSQSRPYPTRVKISGNETRGWIVLDQLRTIDRSRIISELGSIKPNEISRVKKILKEMLVE